MSMYEALSELWKGDHPNVPETPVWSSTLPLGSGERLTIWFRNYRERGLGSDTVLAFQLDLLGLIWKFDPLVTFEDRQAAMLAVMTGWDVDEDGDPATINAENLGQFPITVFVAMYLAYLRHVHAVQSERTVGLGDGR